MSRQEPPFEAFWAILAMNRSQLFLIFFTPQPMLLDGYRLSR